ncbi:hypothetical protein E4T39_02821 [Aureobasidium subglaciale]|nr:hypothetical protein E4T39_02821 [Aureobasidium subglaciale]
MSATHLSPEQSSALFDLLTHHATYDEISQFKSPTAMQQYGPPFQDTKTTSTPILQSLLSKFILPLPGLRDVSPDFWKVRVENMIEELAAANLSESYDKGVLGIRKTLATAISALIEYPARGCYGGIQKDESAFKDQHFDHTKPDDVLRAWYVFMQQLVYGDLFDKLFAKAAETDDLRQHDSLVQAAHEFVVVNLASFMHYTLVVSPEGPSLLRMVENVHKLAPYVLMRQTLRVGNVATMINGMVRLMLAKVSVGSLTNWMGISSGADEGMNLMQQIISTVLGWDKKELKKRLEKIEKDKDAPSKEQREALREWMDQSRQEQEECRRRSQEQSMSIVSTILSLSSASPDLNEKQHKLALEFLSLSLAVRDRNKIIDVLCHHSPDHLTQAVRDGVSAYEPMIRQVHQAVDLSATVADFQAFMDDMIKVAKPKKEGKPPSVEDFVHLLHSHMGASHRFIHQVAKNGKEVTQWFKDYVHKVTANFKQQHSPSIFESLSTAFDGLKPEDQDKVRKEVDASRKYLDELYASSAARISDVISNKASTPYGPGAYLARWQELLDSTLVTPETAKGPVRTGASASVKQEARRDVDGEVKESGVEIKQADKIVGDKTPEAPSSETTIKLLAPKFRELLLSAK